MSRVTLASVCGFLFGFSITTLVVMVALPERATFDFALSMVVVLCVSAVGVYKEVIS